MILCQRASLTVVFLLRKASSALLFWLNETYLSLENNIFYERKFT